jgi:predicted hotdog family 3-hydroxylacyl-ACP dehydratase
MPLSREQFAHLIPHQGLMCLIDWIESWDDATISCRTASHRSSSNPLAVDGRLHGVCGIEYAAQAAALHGGLLMQQLRGRAAPGRLAAVRNVRLERLRLDDLNEDLRIRADAEWADSRGLSYRFAVTAGRTELLEGRLLVMLGRENVS